MPASRLLDADVAPGAAYQGVDADAAEQAVRAGASQEAIAPRAAEQAIGARAAPDRIDSRAAADDVGAAQAVDRVVAAQADDHVGLRGALQPVLKVLSGCPLGWKRITRTSFPPLGAGVVPTATTLPSRCTATPRTAGRGHGVPLPLRGGGREELGSAGSADEAGAAMGERRGGLRGRDAVGLIDDAVMSAMEEVMERLRGPATAAGSGSAPAAVEPRSDERGDPPSLAVSAGSVTAIVGAVVAAIVPAVLSRLDADDLLERIDVQRIVDRIDVDELVGRVDLDAIAGRLDVDALLARVDMDALVHRIDIAAITREALEVVDVGEIVRESTATIGTDIVDDMRLQALRADDRLARWVDVVLRRRGPRQTALQPRGAPR